ncbi:MAG: hypothetical protein WKF97_25395 [Chitinophagaceae bacterium]
MVYLIIDVYNYGRTKTAGNKQGFVQFGLDGSAIISSTNPALYPANMNCPNFLNAYTLAEIKINYSIQKI